jgi:ornithine carbamoyltransferase
MKDLLRTSDLSTTDLDLLLALARAHRMAPRDVHRALEGDTVVLLDWTRPPAGTRTSFEAAVARLGGAAIDVGPEDLELGRGETVDDTARVLSRYARAIVVGSDDDEALRRLAAAATVPVVNAGTARHHPCQSLADVMTIRDHVGPRPAKVAYLGDGNGVATSLVQACALAGLDVCVATPPGYELPDAIVDEAQDVGSRNDCLIRTMHDPYLAVAGADAVYTDVWSSTSHSSVEREKRARALRPYRIDESILQLAPGAIFLHRLPAHRGEEVTAPVVDGLASVVLEQAENRLHTAVAVLQALLSGVLSGAPRFATVGV